MWEKNNQIQVADQGSKTNFIILAEFSFGIFCTQKHTCLECERKLNEAEDNFKMLLQDKVAPFLPLIFRIVATKTALDIF